MPFTGVFLMSDVDNLNRIVMSAGPIYWSYIRQVALICGLKVEESPGWLSRAFVLSGDKDGLVRANKIFDALVRSS
jgi:hypothetical protein